MSRAERPGSGLPANQVDRAPRAELQPKPTELVIAATTSEKRISFLVHAFGDIVRPLNGGTENQALDTMDIVRGKIDHALAIASDIRKKPLSALLPREKIFRAAAQNATIAVAADVTNHTGTIDSVGRTNVEAQNKPVDVAEIKEKFRAIVDDVYNIEASSEVRPAKGKRDGKIVYCPIKLRTEARRTLATERGARKYLKELDNFLKSPIYLDREAGMIHRPSPTDIAGGIELAVLMKLGAIEEIDCIPKDIPEQLTPREQEKHKKIFEAALEDALYLANVGFDRNALHPYVPDIDKKIHNWPWLQGVMAYALGKTV